MRPRSRLPGLLTRAPWNVLVPLAVAQWICVLVFTRFVEHNGWLFYQGGDQTYFYTSAWVLGEGHIVEAKIGYGWSFLLTPLALVVGPSIVSALPWIVLLQTVVLLPIALFAVYGVAARIGGRAIGYAAAVLWVAGPYLTILLWDDRYHDRYVEQYLPQALGLTGLGDFPSMVCLLVAAYLAVRAFDTGEPVDGALAGIAAGFALGIKPANAMFLPAAFLGFAVARRWREALAFAVALLPAALTLTLWKAKGLGRLPLITPDPQALAAGASLPAGEVGSALELSRYLDLDWGLVDDNLAQLREYFWSPRALEWAVIAGLIGAARASTAKAALVGGWFATFALVRLTSPASTLQEGTFLRLFMPAIPAFVILLACIPLLAPRVGARIPSRFPVGLGRIDWRRRPVLAAVAVFAAIPLLLVAVFPPLERADAAKYFPNNTIVPVGGTFTITVANTPTSRDIRWSAPYSGRIGVFYRVLRSEAARPAPDPTLPPGREGIRCLAEGYDFEGGAADCRVEMEEIATTVEPNFIDTDELPPGRWTYRVGLAANWRNDPEIGDVMLLSRPATVRIR